MHFTHTEKLETLELLAGHNCDEFHLTEERHLGRRQARR